MTRDTNALPPSLENRNKRERSVIIVTHHNEHLDAETKTEKSEYALKC